MSKIEKETAQKDDMPETQDDGDLVVTEQAAQDAADPGSEPAAEKTEAREEPEDPRAAIARRYREQRDRDNGKADTGENEIEEPAADVAAKAEPEVKKPDPAPAQREQSDDDEEITLKVDGRDVVKKKHEIIALAQQTVAGDNRLEEAKRLLREAQALRGSAKPEHPPEEGDEEITQQHDQSPKDKAAREHPPKQALDPAKLKGIVERIQVGDSDEGTQALQELVEMTSNRGSELNPEKIGTIVQQHLTETQTKAEINTALADFVKQYPDLAKDEVLADAGRTVLRQELVKDLKSVGVSDADIDAIKSNPQALASAQRQLRAAGHKVRTYGEILGAVGETMSQKFGIKPASASQEVPASKQPPTSAPAVSQDRIDRKRLAPQQPRTAGVRGQVQSAPKPKTRQEVVAGMRKDRGF